jgi:hypothetical protein
MPDHLLVGGAAGLEVGLRCVELGDGIGPAGFGLGNVGARHLTDIESVLGLPEPQAGSDIRVALSHSTSLPLPPAMSDSWFRKGRVARRADVGAQAGDGDSDLLVGGAQPCAFGIQHRVDEIGVGQRPRFARVPQCWEAQCVDARAVWTRDNVRCATAQQYDGALNRQTTARQHDFQKRRKTDDGCQCRSRT